MNARPTSSLRAGTLLVAAAAILCGCVAETVERRRPRKGPVKEVGFVDLGGGRVRYSTEGWSWFVAGRRRHARRLMRKNCGRELVVEVTDEYAREDADIAYSGDDVTQSLDRGLDHYKIAPFQHYAYECRSKGAPKTVVTPSTTAPSPFVVVPARELLPGATVPVTVPEPAPEPAPAPAPVLSTAPAVTEPAP